MWTTCFFLVHPMERFGHWCETDSASRGWRIRSSSTTFSNSFTMQVFWNRGGFSFIWFGFYAFGLCGKIVMTGYFWNTSSSLQQLLDKVKHYSLWWLKTSNDTFIFGTHNWWSNPLVCLGIDWLLCICFLNSLYIFCRFGVAHLVLYQVQCWS